MQVDELFNLNTVSKTVPLHDSSEIPLFLLNETNLELEPNRSPD